MKPKKTNPYGVIKCGWCGRDIPASNKQLAKPHKNGASNCAGSGQSRAAHNFLRHSHAEHKGSLSLPKSMRESK